LVSESPDKIAIPIHKGCPVSKNRQTGKKCHFLLFVSLKKRSQEDVEASDRRQARSTARMNEGKI
jgi:hypothetical protein